MYCKYCGKQTDDTSKYCAHCGKRNIHNEHGSKATFRIKIGIIFGLIILAIIIAAFSHSPSITIITLFIILLAILLFSKSLTKGKNSKSHVSFFSDRSKK